MSEENLMTAAEALAVSESGKIQRPGWVNSYLAFDEETKIWYHYPEKKGWDHTSSILSDIWKPYIERVRYIRRDKVVDEIKKVIETFKVREKSLNPFHCVTDNISREQLSKDKQLLIKLNTAILAMDSVDIDPNE